MRRAASTLELEISVARMEAGGRPLHQRDRPRRYAAQGAGAPLLQKDKLESLGLLAGGIAHDFNNLLVGIMGNASLALETISTNNPARSMLKDVMLASETAANLTRQLLAYAGKGRFVVEPSIFRTWSARSAPCCRPVFRRMSSCGWSWRPICPASKPTSLKCSSSS